MAPFAPSGPAVDDAVIAVARRDRTIVVILLAAAILASWTYVLAGAGMGVPAQSMTSQPSAALLQGTPMTGAIGGMAAMTWSPAHAAVLFTQHQCRPGRPMLWVQC